MAELQLGGKTIATQTGTAEPVLGSGVDISNVTGTLGSGIVFPAGHVIQIPADATLNILSGSTSLTSSYATYLSHSINVTAGNDILVMVSISRLQINGGTSWDGPTGHVKLTDGTSNITQEYIIYQRDNLNSTKYMQSPITIHTIYTPSSTSQTFNLQMAYGTSASSANVYGVRMTLIEIQR